MNLQIRSEATLISKTLPTLRKVFRDNSLLFNDVSTERNITTLELSSSPKEFAETERRQVAIVPFCKTVINQYWIALSITLSSQRGVFSFKGLSITVFFGRDIGSDKTPLFRAEWDETDNLKHAQPHWHYFIHTKSSRTFLADPKTTSFQPTFPTSQGPYDRFDRIHFTMLADWHNENDARHSQKISENNINNWLVNCISYIRDQISFADT